MRPPRTGDPHGRVRTFPRYNTGGLGVRTTRDDRDREK